MCSSNNNISRITKMLKSLRENYGKIICEYNEVKYYDFPKLEDLYNIKEEEYSKMGFGFRGKYFIKSLEYIKVLFIIEIE